MEGIGMLTGMPDALRDEECADEIQEGNPAAREQSGGMRRVTVLFVWALALTLFFVFFNALSTVMLGVLAAAIVSATLSPLMKYIPGPRGVAAGVLGLGLIASVGALVLALSWPLAKPIQRAFELFSQTQKTLDAYL